ncbi:ATP-binding protein [Flavobacterium branchiicola]|uniref:ATP-binding protein n=1 Tax=Flavobacterium branchiicola TaxID=1114875 RepID=A0ABV9PBS9_9FLAO|nr:ATP-binding protein [Flavobacterium branchiicola]MBS7253983.1 ATP-binding protein [Flavobacterium branchiicola]
MINNITGSPVEGANFFGREKELDHAWNSIKKGNSLILSAPRRVGKSSFAKKMLNTAKGEGWNVLEINLEEIKSEEGFVKKFIDHLTQQSWWNKVKSESGEKLEKILSSIKTSIEFGGAQASLEWKSNKSDVYEKLKSLIEHDKETLIMVDELTVLLSSFLENDSENGKKNAEFFLNWLRSFRQVSGTKIRWIFCSSIGIDNFTNQHNLSYTFNDVNSFPLGAFTPLQANEFVQELAVSENLIFSDEISDYILEKIGWLLPYFIQILFSKINHLIKVNDRLICIETVDEAYNQLIDEKNLNTWEERLNDYGDLEIYARELLKKMSMNKEGESRNSLFSVLNSKINDSDKTETLINKLLYMLKNDGYLVDDEIKYAFRSPLLRDFWFNRFVK